MEHYENLVSRFNRIATLQEIHGLLDWDASVIMPPGGSGPRGDQMAAQASVIHNLLTEPQTASDLAAASLEVSDEADVANIREMGRGYTEATAIPADLVEANARALTACEGVWRNARRDSDFALVVPELTAVIGYARLRAEALSAKTGLSPYDALMDAYQPGMRAAGVDPIFTRHESFLAKFLPAVLEAQAVGPAPVPLSGHYPTDLQEKFCHSLAARVGLDFTRAQFGTSTHPFCTGLSRGDVRITTRYNEMDPSGAIFGVLHETGHALYEQNLPAEWYRQPLGQAAGMGAHESQSLIIEMQACLSPEFLGWLSSEAPKALGSTSVAWEKDNLIRLAHKVGPSFIRVDADEVTYPAHVIMRYRLERALFIGDLSAKDLPGAWADGMKKMLGIVPPDDSKGCLQDIHWFAGLFGYFPSYTIGAMAAAQLMAAAKRAIPEISGMLSVGDFTALTGWLKHNVHNVGRRHGFSRILELATGSPLDQSAYEAHLTERYLPAA
jgi:carboxypeptidase Taq